VPKDYAEAAKWLRKSADQGNPTAQCDLGICYFKGDGVQKDRDEAVKWLRKSADQGNARAKKALASIEGKRSKW
jgi:TPR repeat protein